MEKLMTKFGEMYVQPTDAMHIHVCTENGHNIVVNGVEYHIGGHIYLWRDGVWNWGRQDDYINQLHEPYISRQSGNALQRGSYTRRARERVRSEIIGTVREWAKANPNKMREARIGDLQKKLAKAQEENEELTAKVVEKLEEIRNLCGLLAESECELAKAS